MFNVYPKAVSLMPGAPIWAILFFFMIIMVAIDSQFVCVEGFVTAIYDQFEHHLKMKYARETLTAVICIFHFVLGLAMVTEGGIYVFLIFDYYAASGMVLLLFCLCEVIAVSWVYGVNKWSRDVEDMVGHRVNIWLKICWSIITPAASLVSCRFVGKAMKLYSSYSETGSAASCHNQVHTPHVQQRLRVPPVGAAVGRFPWGSVDYMGSTLLHVFTDPGTRCQTKRGDERLERQVTYLNFT